MSDLPNNNFTLSEKLAAFADGEGDASMRLEVLDYLAVHPEAMQSVRDQQRLNIAARNMLRTPAASASLSLRGRIVAMSQSVESTPAVQTDIVSPFGFQTGQWRAMAACLLVGLCFALAWIASTPSRTIINPRSASVVPASIVARASRIHSDCSRLPEALHAASFPTSQGRLAQDVEADLHSSHPYPDLGPIGFRYVGAGPCGETMPDTIHLLYHSVRPGSLVTISLFVQPFANQFPLRTGQIYKLSPATSPFPMLSWRTDNVIYFLIADSDRLAEKVLAAIAPVESSKAAATQQAVQ